MGGLNQGWSAKVAARNQGPRPMARSWIACALSAMLVTAAMGAMHGAQAAANDSVAQLRDFAHDIRSGQGRFQQTVVSADGRHTRRSEGSLAFERPNRFRFDILAPTEQLMVADGKQLWVHDIDLNQVIVRPMGAALDATPAALLAGGDLERSFALAVALAADCLSPNAAGTTKPAQATVQGLQWVQARPRQSEGMLQSICIGLHGGQPAVLIMHDSFGQVTRLDLVDMHWQSKVPASAFAFTPPPGADVLHQP